MVALLLIKYISTDTSKHYGNLHLLTIQKDEEYVELNHIY